MTDAREDRRQFVHAGMTLFALTLRWLTPLQAAVCAAAAIGLNWLILPRFSGAPAGERRGFGDGVRIYPIAVLLLIVVLPAPRAAAAWGVLGIGDAASNLIGRRLSGPRLLGRPDRSLGGTIAFVLLGGAAAAGLWAFVGERALDADVVIASFAAAAAGALAELLWRPKWLDDNLPIAAAAGAVLLLLP